MSFGYKSPNDVVGLLIDPSASVRPSAALKYSYQSSAPAQIDGNLSFYFPQKNCFLQPEFKRAALAPKKRIIHCNPLSDENPLTDIEKKIWNALFDLGYEIIINPNPNDPKTPIEKCIPVKNASEFFRLRGTAYPATADTLPSTLKKQGLNANNYIALDMNKWLTLINEYKTNTAVNNALVRKHDSTKLNLTTLILTKKQREHLIASVDAKSIKKIEMQSPNTEELDFVFTNFPNADEFIIHGTTQEWAKKHFARFVNKTIHILSDYQGNLIIPAIGPKQIIFTKPTNPIYVVRIVEERGTKTELIFSDLDYGNNDLDYRIKQIKTLADLTSDNQFEQAYREKKQKKYVSMGVNNTFIQKPPVEYVKPAIKNTMWTYIPIIEYTHKTWTDIAKSKTHINTNDAPIVLDQKTSFPNVLNLAHRTSPEKHATRSLSQFATAFPNLEVLYIVSSPPNKINFLNNVTNFSFSKLKTLRISNINIDAINSDMFPNIIELYLARSNIKSLGDKPYLNVTKLEVDDLKELQSLDMKLFPNVTDLTVTGCNFQTLDIEKIKQLSIRNNSRLKSIDIEKAHQLQDLKTDIIDLPYEKSNLMTLQIIGDENTNRTKISKLNIKSATLEMINVMNMTVDLLEINDAPNLRTLSGLDYQYAYAGFIKEIKVTNTPKLQHINQYTRSNPSNIYVISSPPTNENPRPPKIYGATFFTLVQDQPGIAPTALYYVDNLDEKNPIIEKIQVEDKILSDLIKILYPSTKEHIYPARLVLSSKKVATLTDLTGFNKSKLDIRNCPSLQTISGDYSAAEIKADSPDKYPHLRLVAIKSFKIDLPALPEDCVLSLKEPRNDYAEAEQSYDSKTSYNQPEEDLAARIKRKQESYAYEAKRSILEKQNNANPVSKFNINNMNIGKVSNEMRKEHEHHAHGNFIVKINSKKDAIKNHYRIRVWDTIQEGSNNQLNFIASESQLEDSAISVQSLRSDKLVDLNDWAQKSANNILGVLKITNIWRNKPVPLPIEEPFDKNAKLEIYCNPHENLGIYWNENTKQYFIANGVDISELTITYALTRNTAYDQKPEGDLVIEPKKLLSDTLIEKIKLYIKTNPALEFLSEMPNTKMTLAEKIEELRKFCASFRDEKETPLKLSSDMLPVDALLARITHRAGACYERSQAFMLLSHYLGVKVRGVVNEIHMFCEIPYANGLRRAELGGTRVNDQTDQNARKDPLENMLTEAKKEVEAQKAAKNTVEDENKPDIAPKAQEAPKTEADTKNDIVKPQKVETSQYKHAPPTVVISQHEIRIRESIKIRQQLEAQQLAERKEHREQEYSGLFKSDKPEISLNTLHKTLKENVLLELPPNQDALSLYPKIITSLKLDQKSDYFYLNGPDDFEDYFKIYYQEKGERKQGKGPLATIIANGGTLIVNWANFTAAQIITYQSILDTKPTLHGVAFSPINIIGLINPDTVTCNAFKSRCKTYTCSEGFVNELKSVNLPMKSIDSKSIEIDLFGRPNWRDYLIERINYNGNTIEFIKKELLLAIEAKKPIHIFNPPNDDSFSIFLHRLKKERRLFHNGKYISISPEVVITTSEKSHDDLLDRVKNTVTLSRDTKDFEDSKDAKTDAPRARIYLGLHNIHECYESLLVKDEKGYTKSKGYLDTYTDQQEFYISDAIPKASWEILMDEIDRNHKGKNFRFILSPTAYIAGVEEKTTETLEDKQSHVFITNDNDYKTLQLQKENPESLIIDVTPQMTFQDLIAKISIDAKKDNVTFHYERKGLLKELLNGKTIILNGELSTRLYQQLLPLFSKDPLTKQSHIYSNGERVEIAKGKLYAVMSPAAQERLGLASYQKHIYTNQDYLNEFKGNEKEIQQILQFYGFVNKVAFRPEYPAPPQLSYVHLKNMLKAIKESKIHTRNPIKHLFHYHYKQTDAPDSQTSEDYAYLNVVAKYIFKPNDTTALRPEKIQKRDKKLQKIINFIKTKELNPAGYVWQILNCLSPTDLQDLFKSADDIIDTEYKVPVLKTAVLQRLLSKVGLLPNAQDKKIDLQVKDTKHQVAKSDVTKRSENIDDLLKVMQLINVKGGPGVGKSFFIEQLKMKGVACYDGSKKEDVVKWKNDKSNTMKVLFMDEANMAVPGSWNNLKPIGRDNKTFFHDGEFHENSLTDLHKVIVTGNPESYAGRHIHQFFQEYGGVVYFKMPSDLTLKENILHDFTKKYGEKYTDGLLSAYNLIKEFNPKFIYSIRDIKNAALSFEILANDTKETKEDILFRTCISEFAGTIKDPITRKKFSDELSKKLGRPIVNTDISGLIKFESGDKTYFIPKDKQYLLDAIDIDLRIREHSSKPSDEKTSLEKQHKHYKKAGLLFEGEPGVGKSTLYRIALEHKGFTEIKLQPGQRLLDAKPAKPDQCFVEINAGDDSALQVLEDAFEKGYIVILNEPNIHPALERKAIELLDRSKEKPGFRIYASQNPSTHEDRFDKPALTNRLGFLNMDPYTRESLIAIAKAKSVEFPTTLIDIFMKRDATMREFFKEINKLEERSKWTFQYYSNQDKPERFKSFKLFSERKLATLMPETKTQTDNTASNFNLKELTKKSEALISQYIPALEQKKSKDHNGIDPNTLKTTLINWHKNNPHENFSSLCKMINAVLEIQLKYRNEKFKSVSEPKSLMMRSIEDWMSDCTEGHNLEQILFFTQSNIKRNIEKIEPGTLSSYMKTTLDEIKKIAINNVIEKYIETDELINSNPEFKKKLKTVFTDFLKNNIFNLHSQDFTALTQTIKSAMSLRKLCKNPSQTDLAEIVRIEQQVLKNIAENKLIDKNNGFYRLINDPFNYDIRSSSSAIKAAKTAIINYSTAVIYPHLYKQQDLKTTGATRYTPHLFARAPNPLVFDPLHLLFQEFTQQFTALNELIRSLADKDFIIEILLNNTQQLVNQASDPIQTEKKFNNTLTQFRELQASIPSAPENGFLKEQINITCDYFEDALKAHTRHMPFPLRG